MPDFVIATIFKSRDQISGTFMKMSRSAGIFGDKSSKVFKRASKAGTGFGNTLRAILTAGFIQRGFTLISNGLREVGRQFISLDQSITSASAKFKDLDLTTAEGQKTLEQLKQTARTTGALTEKTATQAAEGLEFWAKAGANAAQAMTLLPGSVNLATIAEMDLGRASDIASDKLGAFGLMTENTAQLQKNYTRLLDVTAKTMTSTNVDLETLFETTKKGGATFTAAGQSLESFNAIAGILANNAIKGSEAGTMMRNMMLRLSKPTGEAAAIIQNLGIRTRDSQGNFRDIIDIIGDFEKATAKMGTAEKTAALSTIFGARAITGVNILLKEGSGKLREFRSELLNAGGTSEKMATLMRQSLQNRIAALQSAAIELGFQFMETFEKFGGDAIGKLTEIIRAIPMKEIMENLSRLGQPISMIVNAVIELGKAIFSVLNVAFSTLTLNATKNMDVIGTLGEVFQFIAGVIKSFAAGIKFLAPILGPIVAALGAWVAIQWALNVAMAANPIGLIIAGITLLIAGIGVLVKNWDKVVKWFKEGINKIWGWFTKLWNDVLKPIWDFILKIIEEIGKVFEDIGKFISEMIDSIEEFVTGKKGVTAKLEIPEMEKIKKEREFIKGLRSPKEKEIPEPIKEPPNETELRVKSALELRGKVEFTGAPEGTEATFEAGSSEIPVEGLGPNR